MNLFNLRWRLRWFFPVPLIFCPPAIDPNFKSMFLAHMWNEYAKFQASPLDQNFQKDIFHIYAQWNRVASLIMLIGNLDEKCRQFWETIEMKCLPLVSLILICWTFVCLHKTPTILRTASIVCFSLYSSNIISNNIILNCPWYFFH